MTNYVFIVCNPRSGSTLTRNILRQWDSVSVSPELGFLYRVASQRKRFLPLSDPENQQRLSDRIFTKMKKFDVVKSFQKLTGDEVKTNAIISRKKKQLDEFLRNAENLSFRSLYQWIIEEFSVGNGSTFVVKKPVNLYMLPTIETWFPDAKILGLVRDPRDTVVSMTKGDREGLDAFWKAPCLWSFNASRLEAARDQLEDNPFRIQRFEDLIQSPEDTIEGMCDFLNLEYSSEKARNPAHVNSAFEENTRGFNTDVIGRFREKLTSSEVTEIETICRSEMETFHYEPLNDTTLGITGRYTAKSRRYYMHLKEKFRAWWKNDGRYHWVSSVVDT